jgi:hypothetical protein
MRKHSLRRARLSIGLAFLALFGFWPSRPASRGLKADTPKPSAPAHLPNADVYDPDPGHLWNRLYAALYVRTIPDGQEYGHDEADPLLWPSSKYLLTEPRHRQAVTLLDQFLDQDGEKLIQASLKRAIFQRDLWAIFDWLADPHPEYRRKTARLLTERRELRTRLAPILRRLALSPEQIRGLPDNYTAGVAAAVFPPSHDPDRAEKAFLPVDLWRADGPWILLAERGGSPAAPQHVEFTRGRSAFFVFVNLPNGRQATLDYLEKLRTFPNPMGSRPADQSGRFTAQFGSFLNPNLPQFPAGTQFALVRQAMLLDDQGHITPTRLIEMVQIRVVRAIPNPEELPPEKRHLSASLLRSKQQEDGYEFRLRRKDLFAGKAGGLHAVRSDERVFSLFSVQDEDLFEQQPGDSRRRFKELEAARTRRRGTENLKEFGCISCHRQGPGIHSVLSYRRRPPPDLVEANRRDQEQAAVHQKQQHYSWGLLQGLLEGRPRK